MPKLNTTLGELFEIEGFSSEEQVTKQKMNTILSQILSTVKYEKVTSPFYINAQGDIVINPNAQP